MNRLLIARHGNTFNANETPIRIGGRTDLPLVESGRVQANLLGRYLKSNYPNLSLVYASHLKRTYETALIAIQSAEFLLDIVQLAIFNEIDYGIDEGKTDQEIIARIGQNALDSWDKEAKIPLGWSINPQETLQNWYDFAQKLSEEHKDETVLVVTSNGIARFAPYLTGNIETFKRQYSLKISTGALCSLVQKDQVWEAEYWNRKPKEFVG